MVKRKVRLGLLGALAITPFLLVVLLTGGCGGSPKGNSGAPADPHSEPGYRRRPEIPPAGNQGSIGLPGPPSAASAPRSTDPEVRAVEDRLFRTDSGRVILRAVRAQGGWERWREVKIIRAELKPLPAGRAAGGSSPPADAPTSLAPPGAVAVLPPAAIAAPVAAPLPAVASPPGAPPASGAVPINATASSADPVPAAAPPPGGRSIEFRPDGGHAFPAKVAGDPFYLCAPFSLADPTLRFEYLGVEADSSSGEHLDKVRIQREGDPGRWTIAYFERGTGILDRFLTPAADAVAASESKPPSPAPSNLQGGASRFRRLDLTAHRETSGLLLPARWTLFSLPDRYARSDPRSPEIAEEVQVLVERVSPR